MTPRERAERLVTSDSMQMSRDWWLERITTAIQESNNEQLERCRQRIATLKADSASDLQAALEDLARVKQERDGLAAGLETYGRHQLNCAVLQNKWGKEGKECDCAYDLFHQDARTILAAHGREVAARVLRDLCDGVLFFSEARHDLRDIADRYERGEKEVPDEL